MLKLDSTSSLELMRALLLCATLMLLQAALTAELAAQKITDAMNRHVLTVQPDACNLSSENITRGYFKSDGSITNAQNRLLGRISDDDCFYSSRNKLLGRTTRGGKVWYAQNVLLVWVEVGRRVLDVRDNVVAVGNNTPPARRAYLNFFMEPPHLTESRGTTW